MRVGAHVAARPGSRFTLSVPLGFMTLVAQLDTTKSPAPVVALYNYLDASYMVAPTYMDVTSVKPAIQTGCTYNATTKAWAYPAAPESLVTWAKAQIAINNAFLANKSPSPPQQLAQIIALTNQQSRILLRRVGGR